MLHIEKDSYHNIGNYRIYCKCACQKITRQLAKKSELGEYFDFEFYLLT